jgi:hypothetical protein
MEEDVKSITDIMGKIYLVIIGDWKAKIGNLQLNF